MPIGQPEIDSLSNFLKFGPIGLVGLMLVLIVIALSLKITPPRERVLKTSLWLSAGLLISILVANYFIHVEDRRQALHEIASSSDDLKGYVEDLQEIIDLNCLGEANGQTAACHQAITAFTAQVVEHLDQYKTTASQAIAATGARTLQVDTAAMPSVKAATTLLKY
jgi:hypothetical protein